MLINFKDFQRFFKQIAIKLGVNKNDFSDGKNQREFLNLLNLQIWQHLSLKMFCYRFHEVVISIARIAVLYNFGYIQLEPEGGISCLQKYENKLLDDKDFVMTDYKSENILDFQLIYKHMKNFHRKKMNGGEFQPCLDLNNLIEKLKSMKKKELLNPQRNKSLALGIDSPQRSHSKHSTFTFNGTMPFVDLFKKKSEETGSKKSMEKIDSGKVIVSRRTSNFNQSLMGGNETKEKNKI